MSSSTMRTKPTLHRWLSVVALVGILTGSMSPALGQASSRSSTAEMSDLEQAEQLSQQVKQLQKDGYLESAVDIQKEVLRLHEEALGEVDLQVAKDLYLLGDYYLKLSFFEEGKKVLQRAADIQQKLLGEFNPELLETLISLGTIVRSAGNFVEAEPILKRAVNIAEKIQGPESPLMGRTLRYLILLYGQTGRNTEVDQLLEKSLTILRKDPGPDPLDFFRSLTIFAARTYQRGNTEEAVRLFEQVAKKYADVDAADTTIVMTNLAWIYVAAGRLKEAEILYNRAMEMNLKTFGPRYSDIGRIQFNLANLQHQQEHFQDAESSFKKAVHSLEISLGPDHPLLVSPLTEQASLMVRMGKTEEATKALKRAEIIHDKYLKLILSSGSDSQKRELSLKTNDTLNTLISLHLRYPEAPRIAEITLTAILRRKSRVLDILTNNLVILRQHLDPEGQILFDKLNISRSQLATLIYKGSGSLPEEKFREKLTQITTQLTELETQLNNRSNEFSKQDRSISIQAIIPLIPSAATLVEFIRYEPISFRSKVKDRIGKPRYAAYLVDDKGIIRAIDLGEAIALDKAILAFRTFLKHPRTPLPILKSLGRTLDEQLMRPIRQYLGSSGQLFLATDGQLNMLPFATLVDEKQRFLVENYTLSYLNSGQDLLRLQKPAPSRQKALIIANPNFESAKPILIAKNGLDTDRGIKNLRSGDITKLLLKPLPGTAIEGVMLSKLLPDAIPLSGSQATENALKQVHGPRLLHLATHGFFLSDIDWPFSSTTFTTTDNPLLRSGLGLAGFNNRKSGDEDGVLTALEVSGLDLQGTQLVVLSACDTGLGQVLNGQGVLGLRWSFALAGAQSTLLSLWKVDDRQTSIWMEGYYRNLLGGAGRSMAVQRIQQSLLKSKKYRHPYFWGAFIPSGDWRPLR